MEEVVEILLSKIKEEKREKGKTFRGLTLL